MKFEAHKTQFLSAQSSDSAIYVDQPFVFQSRIRQAQHAGQAEGHRWCHMWSSDIEALHAMAEKLGMSREWFQDRPGFPHYDLLPPRRASALKLGAIECCLRDWLRSQRSQQTQKICKHNKARDVVMK